MSHTARFITSLIIFLAASTTLPAVQNISAEAAILVNADNGAILFEKEAKTPHYPASIIKVATAILGLQKGDLDERVTAQPESLHRVSEKSKKEAEYRVPAYWLTYDTKSIYVRPGETFTLKNLLYGLMVSSDGDVANIIAQHVGGTITEFMDQANAYLRDIGCTDTLLLNPHGLHHPDQKTTAYDMSLLAREALKYPEFRKICSTPRHTIPAAGSRPSIELHNHNKLLMPGKQHYENAIGIKTGWHSAAKHTFIAAAEDGDRTLIAVLLRCKNRDAMFQDAQQLFEAAFKEKPINKTLLAAGDQKFTLELPHTSQPVRTWVPEEVSWKSYPSESKNSKTVLYWDWDSLKLPVTAEQKVAELRVLSQDGAILKTIPLFAKETVHSSLRQSIERVGLFLGILAMGISFMIFWRRQAARRGR